MSELALISLAVCCCLGDKTNILGLGVASAFLKTLLAFIEGPFGGFLISGIRDWTLSFGKTLFAVSVVVSDGDDEVKDLIFSTLGLSGRGWIDARSTTFTILQIGHVFIMNGRGKKESNYVPLHNDDRYKYISNKTRLLLEEVT